MRPLRLFLAATCLATTLVAGPAIEFSGVMKTGSDVKIAVTDRASGVSQWLSVGETFRGYTLRAYDAKTDTLVVVGGDGVESRLPLKSDHVTAADPAAPKLTFAAARAIYSNLRQIASAADQFYLEAGKTTATLADLVGETKYIRNLVPVAGEDYATLQLVQGNERLAVTAPSGETVIYDAGAGAGGSFYGVKPGDTIAKIARAAGVTIADLIALNDGMNPSALKIGQPLRLR